MYGSSPRRQRVYEVKRHNITHFISAFLEELKERKEIPYGKVKTEEQAIRLKEFINTPTLEFETPFQIYQSSHEWQEVDFVPSNLGRGYIFYFICNRCEGNMRHLYQPYPEAQPLCRNCHHLTYRQSRRKERRISRLTHKPYLSQEEREWVMRAIQQYPELDLPSYT